MLTPIERNELEKRVRDALRNGLFDADVMVPARLLGELLNFHDYAAAHITALTAERDALVECSKVSV